MKKNKTKLMKFSIGVLASVLIGNSAAASPYYSTITYDTGNASTGSIIPSWSQDIIPESSPTRFTSISYVRQIHFPIIDPAAGQEITLFCRTFSATFNNGHEVQCVSHPDISYWNAFYTFRSYCTQLGRLPERLLNTVDIFKVHPGGGISGGGGILHFGKITADGYTQEGLLEEVYLHELAHSNANFFFDARSAGLESGNNQYALNGWLAIRGNDPDYISEYAKSSVGEDIAESYTAWYALRARSAVMPTEDAFKILKTIPNRIKYFDTLNAHFNGAFLEGANLSRSVFNIGDLVENSRWGYGELRRFNGMYVSFKSQRFPSRPQFVIRINGAWDYWAVGRSATIDNYRSLEYGLNLYHEDKGHIFTHQGRLPEVYSYKDGMWMDIRDIE